MCSASHSSKPDRNEIYQELQRAVPKLVDMYGVVGSQVETCVSNGSRVLIVGAGGGREIAEIGKSKIEFDIVAVDPSSENLEAARRVAQNSGLSERILFINGTVNDVPPERPFDIALSLLVMHQFLDDPSKFEYLSEIGSRLYDNGILIHADICLERPGDLDKLIPEYLSYASSVGIDPQVTQIELKAISQLPIITDVRLRGLFAKANFTEPREVFRTLWYRCWVANRSSVSIRV